MLKKLKENALTWALVLVLIAGFTCLVLSNLLKLDVLLTVGLVLTLGALTVMILVHDYLYKKIAKALRIRK